MGFTAPAIPYIAAAGAGWLGSRLSGSRERSGTSPETRRGLMDLDELLRSVMGGVHTPLQRASEAMTRVSSAGIGNILGWDPSSLGFDMSRAARSALRDPADATRGLFASMQPFEQRQIEQQVAGLRDMFGTMGGRFSRNLMEGESQLRGELANQFARSREEALLRAGALRSQALLDLNQLQLQAQQQAGQGLDRLMNFYRPGPPVIEQSSFPALLSSFMNIAAMRDIFGNKGG